MAPTAGNRRSAKWTPARVCKGQSRMSLRFWPQSGEMASRNCSFRGSNIVVCFHGGDMTAPQLGRALCFMISFILVRPVFVFAQGVPLTLGPLTVTVPAGWIAQTNNTPVRIFSPDSTPQQFFSCSFFLRNRRPKTSASIIPDLWRDWLPLSHPQLRPRTACSASSFGRGLRCDAHSDKEKL